MMKKQAAVLIALVLFASGCGESTTGDGGAGGTAGSGGNAGSGGDAGSGGNAGSGGDAGSGGNGGTAGEAGSGGSSGSSGSGGSGGEAGSGGEGGSGDGGGGSGTGGDGGSGGMGGQAGSSGSAGGGGGGGEGSNAGSGGTGGADLCQGVNCDDGNECTSDSCDATDGMCDYVAVADETPCADGSATCSGGRCLATIDIECPRIMPSVGCLPSGLCGYPQAPPGTGLGTLNSINTCLGYTVPLDRGCYYFAQTKRTYVPHELPTNNIVRVQLCDISEAPDLACIGTTQVPHTWVPESCEGQYPELYQTPDPNGCVELDFEAWDSYVPNTSVVPCGLAFVGYPTRDALGAVHSDEKVATVRILYMPQ